MLDAPHLPSIRCNSIGRSLKRRMADHSAMRIEWEDTDWGGRARAVLDDIDGGSGIEFYRPSIMVLHIPIPGKHPRIHALVIPTGQSSTRLIIGGSRSLLRNGMLNFIFARMNGKIADEDQAVVETTQPGAVPEPIHEHSIGTDEATLQCRKYCLEELKGSQLLIDSR